MARQETSALIIIFDVGKSVSIPVTEDGKSFFAKSRECISWILRRKILSINKDLVSIFLTGTDEEGESLNSLDVTHCRNISIKYDFQLANWDMLNYIEKEVEPRDKMSDWVGALHVAIEKLNILEESYKLTSKTIAVFSDLTYTFAEATGLVMEGIKNFNIEVNVIGSDCFSQFNDDKVTDSEEPAEKKIHLDKEIANLENSEFINGDKLLYMFTHWVGDSMTICNFESAMRHLSCYVKKKVRATPWNCVMDVGDFKISIQLFKKVDRKSHYLPNLKCRRGEDDENEEVATYAEVKRDKIMYYKHVVESTSQTKEVSVGENDFVAGYRYGTSIIPFSEQDKCVLDYKPGKKCFTVLGFTNIVNVPYYSLVGEGTYIVVPRDKDECAEVSLSALIQAMRETGNVAIVRRVYSDDRGLSLGVLYPVIEEVDDSPCKECLIYLELAFHEEVKIVRLPRLRRIENKIGQKQYDLIDNLIDEMNLMKSERGKGEFCEELDLPSRHEVKNQFFSHCIAHKALNPCEPLPQELPENYLKFGTLSESMCNKRGKFEEKLPELFPVKVKGQEFDSVKSDDGAKCSDILNFIASASQNEKTADNCFKKYFEKNEYPPAEGIRRLLDLSENTLNFKQYDIVEAFLNVTREMRKKTIENYSEDYNYWLRRMRIHLGAEKQLQKNYWKGILAGNLGLITDEEHKESCAKKEDHDFFVDSLRGIDAADQEQRTISKEEEEAVNMLF